MRPVFDDEADGDEFPRTPGARGSVVLVGVATDDRDSDRHSACAAVQRWLMVV